MLTKSSLRRTEAADALDSDRTKSKRQQQLADVLNSIENQQNAAKRPKLASSSADADIPYLDELKKLKSTKKTAAAPRADVEDQTDKFVSLKEGRRSRAPFQASSDEDDDDELPASYGGGAPDDSGDGDDDAMEYYNSVAAAADARKSARSDRRQQASDLRESSRAAAYAEMDDEDDGESSGKRKIDRQMEKNTGLSKKVQARKAKDRNPRVKRKVKYQDAVKRRKGAVQDVRDNTKRYAGEQTGIKRNVVRSTKLS